MKVRAHIIVFGKVQGVFYRSTTCEKATQFSLTGWVRNRNDGSVEMVIEGEKEIVEKLYEWSKIGPSMASVDKVIIDWQKNIDEFNCFSVKL